MKTFKSENDLLKIVLNSSTLKELAGQLLPEIMARAGATGGSLLLRRDEVLEVHTSFGLKQSRAVQARIPLGMGVTGQTAQSRSVSWIPELDNEENYIEGVSEAKWELAIPVYRSGEQDLVVVDLESDTDNRPSRKTRSTIVDQIKKLKVPLLNRAKNYRLEQSYRFDSISSLSSTERFVEALRNWQAENTYSEGMLFVLQIKPRLEQPVVSTFEDLKKEFKKIGEQLQGAFVREFFATRLYGSLFCLFIPGLPEVKSDEFAQNIQRELGGESRIEQINYEPISAGDKNPKDLINKSFINFSLTDPDRVNHPVLGLEEILRTGDITFHQQPIFDADRKTVRGREMLLRGPQHSEFHSPKQLVESAYRANRIVALDTLVVNKIFQRLNEPLDYTVFLNVERKSILNQEWRTMFISKVEELDTGATICLELTEHSVHTNLRGPIEELRTRLGSSILVAVDDFGTGMSNYKSIIDLAPDLLKIDRSLIRNVDEDFGQRSLIESITNFASTSDITVLAEGIEETTEWETLKNLGVDLVQGYHFAQPKPFQPHVNGRVPTREA